MSHGNYLIELLVRSEHKWMIRKVYITNLVKYNEGELVGA